MSIPRVVVSVCVCVSFVLFFLPPEASRALSMCILSGPVKETVDQRILGAWSRYGSTALSYTTWDDSSLTVEGVSRVSFIFACLCAEDALLNHRARRF